MKLVYKILWVEDNEDFVDSFDNDALREFVEAQGFELEVEHRIHPDQIKSAVDGTQYDLLVVDFNIAEADLDGGDLIRQVREADCLTDVIFYSQTQVAELRKVAADKELEGVFFSSRDKDQLIRKIEAVFNQTIRKVVDLENMRGLIMAGVADLDHLVSDVIRAVHDQLDAGRQVELCKRLLKKMRPVVKHLKALVRDQDHAHFGDVEKLIDAIVDLDPSDFEALIAARSFDSSRRVDMLVSLSKEDGRLKPHKDDFGNLKDLLDWRNALAHQKPKAHDADGNPVFSVRDTDSNFDSERRRALRSSLREHQARLRKVLEAVKDAGAQ